MCLLGQASLFNVILNLAAPLLILNPYYQSILEIQENNLLFITIKVFVILPSIISFWPNLLSFTLPQIRLPYLSSC